MRIASTGIIDKHRHNLYSPQLIKHHQYIDAKFNIADLQITNEGVLWKGIQAKRIVFCDGIGSMENPYFKMLPFAPNKGEALIVEIKDLPNEAIYKHNLTIVLHS